MIASKFIKNLPLKKYTRYKIGGPSKYFFIAESLDELINSLYWCREVQLPWFVLGRGSNLLISDHGFEGLTIKLGKAFDRIKIDTKKKTVKVGGATLLPKLGMTLVNSGWGDFEFMCGIPGTLGGAILTNAGTKAGEIKDSISSVKILKPNGQFVTLYKDQIDFSYRNSSLKSIGGIILEAEFRLRSNEDPESLRASVRESLSIRRKKQPKNRKNCGSVFRNPAGLKSAGWFIDQAGLKGKRVNDAVVAEEHGNWILNLGNATSLDIKTLIEVSQKTVFEKFGVALKREVIYVPDDVVTRN